MDHCPLAEKGHCARRIHVLLHRLLFGICANVQVDQDRHCLVLQKARRAGAAAVPSRIRCVMTAPPHVSVGKVRQRLLRRLALPVLDNGNVDKRWQALILLLLLAPELGVHLQATTRPLCRRRRDERKHGPGGRGLDNGRPCRFEHEYRDPFAQNVVRPHHLDEALADQHNGAQKGVVPMPKDAGKDVFGQSSQVQRIFLFTFEGFVNV